MDPSDVSCHFDINVLESYSECELDSDSTQELKDGELSSEDKLQESKQNQYKITCKLDTEMPSYMIEENEYEENSLVLKETPLPSIDQANHTSENSLIIEERHSPPVVSDHKEDSLPMKREENSKISRKLHSLPIIEDHVALKKKATRLEERDKSPIVLEETHSLALINEEQTSKKKEESLLKEREDRPLVLEERHSLSIAETKKRRASVYCDGNLFIPKELARGELHQRRNSSAASSQDSIDRNRDNCIRMLTFPVGSGRARYVAQQLRRRKSKERKLSIELQHGSHVESSIKEEPLSMANNGLNSDDECCIVLEEIVDANGTETEDDGTDDLIERVSKRQMKRAASLELRSSKDNELVVETQDQQHLPVYRWHVPACNESSIKMGLMEELNNVNGDSQVGLSEADATATVAEVQPRVTVEEVREEAPDVELQHQLQQQQQSMHPSGFAEMEQEQQNFQVEYRMDDPQQQQQLQQQQLQQQQLQQQQLQQQQFSLSQEHVADVPSHSNAVEISPLRQHLIMPRIHTEVLPQPNRVSNNAVNVLNQNLQQHYEESLVPNELLQQWSKEQYGNYAFIQTAPQEQQLSHTLQQQQSNYLWQQQQQQYQSYYQEQQQLEARREELQQLNENYQRLKRQEDEKLRSINRSLKDVYVDRLTSERQHAELHRMFLQKMNESKKQEESLQAQKELIKRQSTAERGNLKQHIAEKQRQLQECNRTWQWQQQHYQQQKQQQQQQQLQQQQQQHQLAFDQQQQQQHQLAFEQQQQQQQQYFRRQLQPPAYPLGLQSFQDAYEHYTRTATTHTAPPVGVHSVLMAPPLPAPPAPPPPPPAVYRAENLQSAVTPESNARGKQRIMRRRHTIDHRMNNTMIYAQPTAALQSLPQQPRHSSHRTRATSTNPPAAQHHFALPETSRISNDARTQVNQAIEQTAITSIISNYVTNYLNDMEFRNS